jgi:MFS family permease
MASEVDVDSTAHTPDIVELEKRSVELEQTSKKPTTRTKSQKGSAFWLSFVAVIVSILLGALDLTAVSTALPTITDDLHGGDDFVWVGSAYALSSTAFLPLSGNLADVFGRRPIMLLFIAVFSVGSALAGAAQSMNMMIAARSEFFQLSGLVQVH